MMLSEADGPIASYSGSAWAAGSRAQVSALGGPGRRGWSDRRAGHHADSRVDRYMERASPNLVTALLIGVAGITFLVKAGGGLYWLIPAVLAGLVGGVINAWLFLVRVPA